MSACNGSFSTTLTAETLRPVRRRRVETLQVGSGIDCHWHIEFRLLCGICAHEQSSGPAFPPHLVDVAPKGRIHRPVVLARGVIPDRVLEQGGQRYCLLLFGRVLDPEHECRQWHLGKPRVERRKWAERRQLHLHRQTSIPETQHRHRVFARHLALLHSGPLRPAGSLQQPGRPSRPDQEMQRHVAIAQRIEELPVRELAIYPDLKVPCADAPQMHPRVSVLAGQVKPGFGGANNSRCQRCNSSAGSSNTAHAGVPNRAAAAPAPTSPMNSRRFSPWGPQCPEQLHLRIVWLIQFGSPRWPTPTTGQAGPAILCEPPPARTARPASNRDDLHSPTVLTSQTPIAKRETPNPYPMGASQLF